MAILHAIAAFVALLSFVLIGNRVAGRPLEWNHLVGLTVIATGVLLATDGPFPQRVFPGKHRAASGHGDGTLLTEVEDDGNDAETPLPSPPPPPSPPPSPSPPPPPDAALAQRLDYLARASRAEREQALRELRAGQKRGHWIWWAFPTLAARGGDMNSQYMRADLADVAEARGYAAHAELRQGLLDCMRTADAAFSRHSSRAPYRVMDAGFGRHADGTWVSGPADSFKVRASATLFAAVAEHDGDDERRDAALRLLRRFTGDVVYTAGGPGTAGYAEEGGAPPRNVLAGLDEATLALLPGGEGWDDARRSIESLAAG